MTTGVEMINGRDWGEVTVNYKHFWQDLATYLDP